MAFTPAPDDLIRPRVPTPVKERVDFGLVSNVCMPAGSNPRLTMGAVALGTPPFMSPEMVMGQPVDARSDLYALGCVAYWLITGTEVFTGRSAVEIMSLHSHAPPEPPSQRVAGIPATLEAVVLSCLEKSPAARPASAAAISDALASVTLEPPWGEAQAAAWWSHVPPAANGKHA